MQLSNSSPESSTDTSPSGTSPNPGLPAPSLPVGAMPCVAPPEESSNYLQIKPRQLVLVAACFAAGTALSVSQVDRVFIFIIVILIASLKIFNVNSKLLITIAVAFAAGAINAEIQAPRPSETDICRFSDSIIVVNGVISKIQDLSSGKAYRLVLECHSASRSPESHLKPKDARHPFSNDKNKLGSNETKVSGQLQATIYPSASTPQLLIQNLKEGNCISLRGKLTDLAAIKNPRLQRVRLMLSRKKIFCQIRTSAVSLLSTKQQQPDSAGCIEAMAGYWRKSLTSFHRKVLGDQDGDLLTSMVLGDRAVNPSKEISANFRASGLSHILAASGFNLTIVAASIYFVLRFCTGNLWASNSICLAGMFVYVAVAGPSPSILRAFLMGAFVLLARCLGRTLHMPAALALTMLIVLVADPYSAIDVGFQLSYFSTAGMILGASHFAELLGRRLQYCPRWIKEVLAATLVAQSCVLPLQLYYFRQLTTYCLLANVLVSPLVAPLTIFGFAGSLLYVMESLSHLGNSLSTALDRVCYFPLEIMRQTVAYIAALPAAQVNTGQAHLAPVVIYYLVLLIFPFLRLKGKLKLWTILFVLSLATMFISQEPDGKTTESQTLRAHHKSTASP